MQSGCKIWSLERYARLTSADQALDDWEYFNNEDFSLELTLTSTHQLLLHHGKTQMESLCLADTGARMKGMSMGNSLMIFIKMKDQARRIRIKFSAKSNETAKEACRKCVDQLSQYFQIKIPGGEEGSSQQLTGTPLTLSGQSQTSLSDDVTLGQIACAITNTSSQALPQLYSQLTNEIPVDLDTVIKLCLTDPTFPAFVETVEKHLDKIQEECS